MIYSNSPLSDGGGVSSGLYIHVASITLTETSDLLQHITLTRVENNVCPTLLCHLKLARRNKNKQGEHVEKINK